MKTRVSTTVLSAAVRYVCIGGGCCVVGAGGCAGGGEFPGILY